MKILATVLCLCIAAGAVSAQDSTAIHSLGESFEIKEYPQLYLLVGSAIGIAVCLEMLDNVQKYNDQIEFYETIDDQNAIDKYSLRRFNSTVFMVTGGVVALASTYLALKPKTHHINLTMAGDLTAPKLCLSYRF